MYIVYRIPYISGPYVNNSEPLFPFYHSEGKEEESNPQTKGRVHREVRKSNSYIVWMVKKPNCKKYVLNLVIFLSDVLVLSSLTFTVTFS